MTEDTPKASWETVQTCKFNPTPFFHLSAYSLALQAALLLCSFLSWYIKPTNLRLTRVRSGEIVPLVGCVEAVVQVEEHKENQPPMSLTIIYLFCLVQVLFWASCSGAYSPPNYGAFDTYKPSRATTGYVTSREQLTNYNLPSVQKVVLSTPGEVITSKIIYGELVVKAAGVILQDCLLVGPSTRPSSTTAVVSCLDPSVLDTIIRDCTIEPRFPNSNLDGIKGSGFKAYRNHIYWTVDGFGVFTLPGSGNPTSVEIAGNFVEAMAYFHGGYYSDINGGLLLKTGGYTQWNGNANDYVARPADSVSDPGHRDGTHNDGVQVQGGYGGMTMGSDGKWSGDGIYIHGNFFQIYDAEHTMENPSGSSYPVPGQSGSIAGSSVGTQDNPKRATQAPAAPVPVTNGKRMLDGKYPINGQGLIISPNVNQFPFPNAANPTTYTCVMQFNWLDDYACGASMIVGPYTSLNVALLYNRFGPHVLEYGASTSPSTYPIRIYEGKKTNFAPALDGYSGLYTNVWDDPTNRWGQNGSPLQPGKNSGIRYDDGYVPTPAPTRPPTPKPTPQPTPKPTPEPVRCVTAPPTWQATTFPSVQTGSFTFSFRASVVLESDNAVFGLSNGVQTTYQGYSANVRFDSVTRTFQAWQGTGGVGYKSDATLPYVVNTQYSFTFAVNVIAQTYSVQVQPAGGSTVTLASNYGFRVAASQLTHYGIIDSFANSNTIFCQFKLNGLLL